MSANAIHAEAPGRDAGSHADDADDDATDDGASVHPGRSAVGSQGARKTHEGPYSLLMGDREMHEWSGAEHMGGMWLWWLVAVAIIAAIVWAMARSSSRTSGDTGEGAEELLKRRYASGEIDKDDYEKRLQDLRG